MLPHVPLDEALLSLLPDIYRTVRVHISPAHELSTCGELDPRDSLITRGRLHVSVCLLYMHHMEPIVLVRHTLPRYVARLFITQGLIAPA